MSKVELSVVIPVVERGEELIGLNADYLDAIELCGVPFEVIYVLDRYSAEVDELTSRVIEADDRCNRIVLPKTFGDATALATGLQACTGSWILILTPYAQIEPKEIPSIVDGLRKYDVVVAERDRQGGSLLNRIQARSFNVLAKRVTNIGVDDVTSEVRALRSTVRDEVDLYGDMHRFLPHLAFRLGFRIGSVKVGPAPGDKSPRVYHPGIYIRRLLDVLTALFLIRFTKKPLRFFGLIGLTTLIAGIFVVGWTVFERLFFGIELADRPALFLGALAIVLGLQVVAIGLVGEIVIFAHAKNVPQYRIGEIIEYPGTSTEHSQEALENALKKGIGLEGC